VDQGREGSDQTASKRQRGQARHIDARLRSGPFLTGVFERFTNWARRVIVLLQEEEHLLGRRPSRMTGQQRRSELSYHRSDTGHGRNDLTSLDHFAESLAVGIFTDESWVENVPRVTR
jgi:hypothetical protein